MQKQGTLKGLEKRLTDQSSSDNNLGIKEKFRSQPDRPQRFSYDVGNFLIDFSKSHISDEVVAAYTEWADLIEFHRWRKALFTGEKINQTENRSVLHTLLRDPENHGIALIDEGLKDEAKSAWQDLRTSLSSILEQLNNRDSAVKDIIHIGIGGSSLGTQLLFEALRPLDCPVSVHFVSNIDGHELAAVLSKCDPVSTLVVGVSKTFTTAETLQNIRSVKSWYQNKGGQNFWNQVLAVTASAENAQAFGVPAANTVVFPQWVGGRYSVWSSVSLSAILAFGIEPFEEFLEGAANFDRQFFDLEPAENPAFLAGALDHYYVNFMGAKSRAIFAYDYRLRSLVDYLQQLETESNGKDVQRNGERVDQHTAPVIWGGVGTNVQHSVFQMLHQGTNLIPAEFILVRQPDHDLIEHHKELLANGIAQTAALLEGQTLQEVIQNQPAGLSDLEAKAKVFTGERPSITLLCDRLSPRTLGQLLAFYEQRTFCFGILCNINSFDQMGVELGKRLAKQVAPRLEQDAVENASNEFDPSTEQLLRIITSSED